MPRIPTDPDLLDFLDECGWSPNTLRSARSILCLWEDYLTAAGVELMAANHRHLRAWLEAASDLAGSTRHKRWQVVSDFYKWAARPVGEAGERAGAGILTANPMARCRAPHVPVSLTARVATTDQADAIVGHFLREAQAKRGRGDDQRERALRNAAMVSLMMRSGLRSADVAGLDVHHLVRDDGGQIVAVIVGGDDGMRTKSRRRRVSPVLGETPRLLTRYLRQRGDAPGPLFLGRRAHCADPDRRMQATAVQRVIRRGATACGIELSAHDLRRGAVVEARRRGVPSSDIKRTVGLSSDALVDRYSGAHADDLAVESFRRHYGDARLGVAS